MEERVASEGWFGEAADALTPTNGEWPAACRGEYYIQISGLPKHREVGEMSSQAKVEMRGTRPASGGLSHILTGLPITLKNKHVSARELLGLIIISY